MLLVVLAALLIAFAAGGAAGYAVGRRQHLRAHLVATNAAAIVGKRVRVIEGAGEDHDSVVLLTGEHWKARSAAGALRDGDEARVVALDGLCLIVVPERSAP